MKKPVCALELCSKSIKVVIGYVINGQVQVLYVLNKPFDGLIDAGNFSDVSSLKRALESINVIEDESAKLLINVNDALVALPPFGLEVYQTNQITNVISEDSLVSTLDISNVYTLVRKSGIPESCGLVDIIPSSFILDEGKTFNYPPIGQPSHSLQVSARIHTLPKNMVRNYVSVIEQSGISVKRTMVAPQGTIELLASYGDEYPNEYYLVDIGSDITTVSLVGKKQLFGSRFFSWGGDKVTEKIMVNFNCNEQEAEKYKMMYGLDKRQMTFDAVICSSDDGEGHEIKHTVSEFNKIIKQELDVFARELNSAITDLLRTYDNPLYRKFTMVLVGGGSALYGLKEFLEPKVDSEKVMIATPKTIGARDASYFNCLGMILLNEKYPNAQDDSHQKVEGLSRNALEEDK